MRLRELGPGGAQGTALLPRGFIADFRTKTDIHPGLSRATASGHVDEIVYRSAWPCEEAHSPRDLTQPCAAVVVSVSI